MVNKGGKKACPTCRAAFPPKFVANPRVNTALTFAIRMAKQGKQQPAAAKPFVRCVPVCVRGLVGVCRGRSGSPAAPKAAPPELAGSTSAASTSPLLCSAPPLHARTGLRTRTGRTRRSPRSARCGRGAPTPRAGASWSTCPTTTLAPSRPPPTRAARCAASLLRRAPLLASLLHSVRLCGGFICSPYERLPQLPQPAQTTCPLSLPLCGNFICSPYERLSQLPQPAETACPLSLPLPPSRRACAWGSGGRTGWTAGSGARTSRTWRALQGRAARARRAWCSAAATSTTATRASGSSTPALAAATSPATSAPTRWVAAWREAGPRGPRVLRTIMHSSGRHASGGTGGRALECTAPGSQPSLKHLHCAPPCSVPCLQEQSFDQKFESSNKALQVSCLKGLPVRVVRSFKVRRCQPRSTQCNQIGLRSVKGRSLPASSRSALPRPCPCPAQEKRSAYAPSEETPVRYDGIYRIAKCWRKPGEQGFLICRYLFVRADNEPAPWSSDGALHLLLRMWAWAGRAGRGHGSRAVCMWEGALRGTRSGGAGQEFAAGCSLADAAWRIKGAELHFTAASLHTHSRRARRPPRVPAAQGGAG